MQTQRKLVALELIAGIFGWVWIGASVATIYFLGSAAFFDGAWTSFFWAFGIGIVAKWLARGFNDNKSRVAYEAALIAHGLSPEEAGRAWLEAYSGGQNRLAEFQAASQEGAES